MASSPFSLAAEPISSLPPPPASISRLNRAKQPIRSSEGQQPITPNRDGLKPISLSTPAAALPRATGQQIRPPIDTPQQQHDHAPCANRSSIVRFFHHRSSMAHLHHRFDAHEKQSASSIKPAATIHEHIINVHGGHAVQQHAHEPITMPSAISSMRPDHSQQRPHMMAHRSAMPSFHHDPQPATDVHDL
ncbi:hypothetical protein ACLOJK_014785 [Asimina triloba]